MSVIRRSLLGAAALLWLTTACNAPPQGGGCRVDSDCEPLAACLARTCVARDLGPRALHVAVFPAPDVAAALTELTEVVFAAAAPPTVMMARSMAVLGTAKSLPNAPFALLGSGELAVSAVLLSRITGAAAVELGTVASIAPDAGPGVAKFALAVPENRLGATAVVSLLPRAPIDAVTPPVVKQLALVNNIEIMVPGAADLRVVEGNVRTEFDRPALGYIAQVLRKGQTVSIKAPVGEDGRFRVSFPRAADAASDAATLLLASQTVTSALPRLTMELPAAATDVGIIRFVAHPNAQLYRVPVVSVGAGGVYSPVVGALVRFETRLSATGAGITSRYVQEVQSGKDGTVDIPLIAGGPETPRDYAVEIVSPSASDAGSRCIASFPIGSPSGDPLSVPTTAVIELPRRPALAGVIKRPDDTPLGGAVITAVRLGPLPGSTDCAVPNRLGDPFSLSDPSGAFSMRVEAGVFRIEVQPPTGEALPFSTWDAVVTNDGLQMNLVVPTGRVAEGKALTFTGEPCAACRVMVYEGPLATVAKPRAETVTGPNGMFRFVLPAL